MTWRRTSALIGVLWLLAGCRVDHSVTPEATPTTVSFTASSTADAVETTASPRLIEPGQVVVTMLRRDTAGDSLTLLGEAGEELTTIDFDGTVWIQEVSYPERLMAVVSRDDEIERFVINTATGTASSLGMSSSIQQWGFNGQQHAGSRWYLYTSLLFDGSQELVDLETMTTRPIPFVGGIDPVQIAPTDGLIAIGDSPSSIQVLDAHTFDVLHRLGSDAEVTSLSPFSPDGSALLIFEGFPGPDGSTKRSDLVTRTSIVDVESGEITPILDDVSPRGWFSDTEILVESVDGGGTLIVSATNSAVVSTEPPLSDVRGTNQRPAPWQIVELDDTLLVVERLTGDSRTVALRNSMAPIVGVGRVPGLRFVWANAGGANGALNELSVLVIDNVTGESHEFFESIDGGFIGPLSISLSADASSAIAVSAEGSFLMRADGTILELPAARSSSFCADDRFVLTTITGEREQVLLYEGQSSEPVATLGEATTAFCTGG